MVISDFWECDFGARSIESRMNENDFTIADWVRTRDDISDEDMDEILQRISERSRSKLGRRYTVIIDLH